MCKGNSKQMKTVVFVEKERLLKIVTPIWLLLLSWRSWSLVLAF
jgi:hypothetical protein